MTRLAEKAPGGELTHRALVDFTLRLISDHDPRLSPLIHIDWTPAKTSFGKAQLVPEGWWYSRGGRIAPAKFQQRCRLAEQPLGIIRISSYLWRYSSPLTRGETVAHELSHLSDFLDMTEKVGPEKKHWKRSGWSPHGVSWRLWTQRYTGRVLKRTSGRNQLNPNLHVLSLQE